MTTRWPGTEMINKKNVGIACLIILILISSDFSTAWGQTSQTDATADVKTLLLSDCLQLGIKNDPQLKAWQYEIEKAIHDQKIARSNLGPTLSLNGDMSDITSQYASGLPDTDYIDQNQTRFDIALVQPVFSGFSNIRLCEQSRLQVDWVKAKQLRAEAETALKIQTLVLKLLKAREDVVSLKKTELRLIHVLKSAEAFDKVNMAPYVNVLQAGVNLADARQLLSQAENDLHTLTLQMNIAIGFHPDQKTQYFGDLYSLHSTFSMTQDESIRYAFANRPDYIAARLSQDISKNGVHIEAGRFYPQMRIEGHYIATDRQYEDMGITSSGDEYDRDQTNEYWLLALNLRWTIFDSGRTYHSLRKARQEVNRQEEIIRTLENQIQTDVRVNYANMNEAHGRIDVTRKAQSAALENYDLNAKRYELQIGTGQEVLDAQERLTKAEVQTNQAMADYYLAMANLYLAIGLRNDDLDKAVDNMNDLKEQTP